MLFARSATLTCLFWQRSIAIFVSLLILHTVAHTDRKEKKKIVQDTEYITLTTPRYSGQIKRQLQAPGGDVEVVGSDDEAKGGFKHGEKVGRMWVGKQEGACNKEVACV
jgi:hypothetical protein